VVSHPTIPQAALIYRLSGDTNPLHVDPDYARRHGFEKPILHGLCSFGIASCALIAAGQNAPTALRRLDARFCGPVIPGETVVTQIWRIASHRFAFRSRVAERGSTVIDRGYCEFGRTDAKASACS
jgi:acyl dehydratase